jgi:hypothetical protein
MEHLYIVLWRGSDGIWKAESRGVFHERRIADNFIECAKAAGEQWDFAVVEGPIVSPESMAEIEARLGTF